ncbi:Hypothetical predicted protein [Mytilus galloprovincialis]|uniref:B box-type domain-containing protein n=1 Tax=Mytilus galloprovincialis TaxID=29158 RepID=A0A8B6GYW0_MYTGA|nr:Hypothetical predicted protein [Mytilus galloprovincialis]
MASADQHVCKPCSRGETVSSGYSWCSDCEEILCDVCDKSHRVNKLTLSHNLTEIGELPFIPKETVINFRLCGNHPEKIVDFYCAFHDVVCCQTCIAKSHRACQQVKVIDDVSGGIKSSALVEDASKAVSSLLKTFQSVIENRNNNKESVFLKEPIIKTSIAKLKQDLLQHVESLEKSLLSELSKLKSDAVSQLDTDLAETKSMSKSWQKIKQELDFNIEHGSNNQLFRLVQHLKNKISDEETKLQDNLTRTMNLDLEYFVKEDLCTIISSHCKVNIANHHCGISHISQLHLNAQFVPAVLSFTQAKSIDLSLFGTRTISGIEIIADRLLLCHFNAGKILVYKNDDTFIKEKCIEIKPYQISKMPNESQVAVTTHESSTILIIDSESLDSIRMINTKKSYTAVETLDHAFIVGGDHVLDIISFDGSVNRSFIVPHLDESLIRYIRKRQDDTLLFTNSYNLYCIRVIDGSTVFEYSSTTEARGIAEDQYGNIYVADKKQKNIHRLAPDGAFIDIVLTEDDGIGIPIALHFSVDYSKLYIGMQQHKMLAVFKCK